MTSPWYQPRRGGASQARIPTRQSGTPPAYGRSAPGGSEADAGRNVRPLHLAPCGTPAVHTCQMQDRKSRDSLQVAHAATHATWELRPRAVPGRSTSCRHWPARQRRRFQREERTHLLASALARSSPRAEGNRGITGVFSPRTWEQIDLELACRSPCARVALRKSRRSLFPINARTKSRFSDGEASWVFGNFGLAWIPTSWGQVNPTLVCQAIDSLRRLPP
jgi:hypothetical protein